MTRLLLSAVLSLTAAAAMATPFTDVSFAPPAAPLPTFIEGKAADILGPWSGADQIIEIGTGSLPSLAPTEIDARTETVSGPNGVAAFSHLFPTY